MFVTGNRALNDDPVAFLKGSGISLFDFLARFDVDENAAPVISIERLDANRQADVLRGLPSIFRAVDLAPLRHRHAAIFQQCLGEILVVRNAHGDGAGLVGFRRPDAAQRSAVAELDEIAGAQQADVRNFPHIGGLDNAGCRGAEVVRIDQFGKLCDRCVHIERPIGHGR